MKNKNWPCLLILLIAAPCISHSQNKLSAKELFNEMMLRMSNVRTCTYVLNMEERVFDKIGKAQYLAKVNVAPLKIYTYSVFPNPGAEALYVEHSNSNKVLVNPNRFPYINVNLSVNSMLLRKTHQYNIRQMGFGYFHEIMKQNAIKFGDKFYNSLHLKEDIFYNNKSYLVLEILNDDFGYVSYEVKENENVTSIANKWLVNDHMILELNPEISDYDDVETGQVIKIPNSFAKHIILYLDKTTLLPLVQMVFDDKGFYSRIELSSFILNPVIQDEEFSRYYSKYKF